MRFSSDSSSTLNIIRSYGAGQFRINEETFHSPLIVGPTALRTAPDLTAMERLGDEHVAQVLALQPELVLLGTGNAQIFPNPAFGARFLAAGVGFEVMNTGAACRTFNVLVAEHRQVVALLMLNEI